MRTERASMQYSMVMVAQMRPPTQWVICIVKSPPANSILKCQSRRCATLSSDWITNSLPNRRNWWVQRAHGTCPIAFLMELFAYFLLVSQRLMAGTTALCTLYCPVRKRIHVAWVGDSKALLVTENQILPVVEPHKPCSEVRNMTFSDGVWNSSGCRKLQSLNSA